MPKHTKTEETYYYRSYKMHRNCLQDYSVMNLRRLYRVSDNNFVFIAQQTPSLCLVVCVHWSLSVSILSAVQAHRHLLVTHIVAYLVCLW